MKINQFISLLLMSIFLFLSTAVMAEVAVIVHPSNTDEMDRSYIKKIFLGKKKKFPKGASAVPLVLSNKSHFTASFNKKVVKKSNTQMKSYWAKKLFTGKGTPPKVVTDSEMIKLISTNPDMIGYIDAGETNNSIRVLDKF